MTEKNNAPMSVRNWTLEIECPLDYPNLRDFTTELSYLMAGDSIAPIKPTASILLCGFVERGGLTSDVRLGILEIRRSLSTDKLIALCENDVNYEIEEDNMAGTEHIFYWLEKYEEFPGDRDDDA